MIDKRIDKVFFWIVVSLVLLGFFAFTSASLGLLAKEGIKFSDVALNQVFFGIFLGSLALLYFSRVKYTFWQKYGFYIFIASVLATLLVFIPGIGIEHGGAKRWIDLGFVSFQPAEFLKLGLVVYLAALLSSFKPKIKSFSYGFVPLAAVLGVSGLILLSQPDTGTLLVIVITAMTMFIAAGGRWKHVLGFGALGGIAATILVFLRPYIMDRVVTFLDPSKDPLGLSYQIQQSLIAIGSGGIIGKGFGQSLQKFDYLPEAIGDSIFAIWAEEFGFIGAASLIVLFLFFAIRGLRIARISTTHFGRLLAIGLVILIVSQSFINIASMLGVFPITGMPLLFVSHGGTALFFTLLEVGIILNISKYRRERR